MPSFKQRVLIYLASLPKGRVVSYGQVAANCGSPRAARQVGGILRGLNYKQAKNIPWWRVVNNQGIISITGNWTATKEIQAQLLRNEGIVVKNDFVIDIERYRHLGGGSEK